MQQIEQVDKIGEEIISEVVQRVNSNFTKFQKYMQQNYKTKKVIILCGNTGAGKSTIYNWIQGAVFKINDKDNIKYLDAKKANEQMNISTIGSSATSITKTTIYTYIEELDHVLVDLPGFESTIDEYHKLFIDLLYQKIIGQFQTKIVYVLDSPQMQLQNRGQDFIQFINQQMGQNLNNVPNIFLIINKYSQEGTDNEQIQSIKEQLKGRTEFQGRMPKRIHIIRKITNEQMIQQIFSENTRMNLIQSLIQSEIITQQSIQAQKLTRVDIVNNYLMQKSTFYFKQLKEMYLEIKKLIDQKQNFYMIPNNQSETNSNSNSSIPETIESLFNLYTYMISKKQSDLAVTDDFQDFKKIYDYFLPYKDDLSSYYCMNSLVDGEKVRFNSVFDYLKQNSQLQTTENQSNKSSQLQTTENQSNKFYEIVGNITQFIIRIAEKVITIRFQHQYGQF